MGNKVLVELGLYGSDTFDHRFRQWSVHTGHDRLKIEANVCWLFGPIRGFDAEPYCKRCGAPHDPLAWCGRVDHRPPV